MAWIEQRYTVWKICCLILGKIVDMRNQVESINTRIQRRLKSAKHIINKRRGEQIGLSNV